MYRQIKNEVASMKRITINAFIDIGCLVTFILSLATGLVLYIFLPEGSGRGTFFQQRRDGPLYLPHKR